MKVIDAISRADALKPNAFPLINKIEWLSRLDERIYEEIISTHLRNDGEDEIVFSGYSPEDQDATLLVAEPYAEMYIHWLQAQIDYYSMEYVGFNACNAMFESLYSVFRNAYNASHMPMTAKKAYF